MSANSARIRLENYGGAKSYSWAAPIPGPPGQKREDRSIISRNWVSSAPIPGPPGQKRELDLWVTDAIGVRTSTNTRPAGSKAGAHHPHHPHHLFSGHQY